VRFAAALLLFAPAFLAPAAAAQGFERWLPPRTFLHFSIHDATRLRRHLDRGPLPAIFARPDAREALGELRSFLVGRGTDPDSAAALLAHPTGPVSIALWDAGRGSVEEFEIEGVLLADVRGNEALFLRDWKRMLAREDERHTVVRGEQRAGDVTIHAREFRIAGEPMRSAWFLHRGVFGFAPRVRSLRRVLAVHEDRLGSLSADSDHARFSKRCSADSDIRFWISRRLWGPAAAPHLQETLKAAGLDDLRGVGVELSFVSTGVFSRVFLDVRGKRRGLLAVFREPLANLGPPAWLPPRLEGAATFHLDHARVLKEAVRVADTLRPGIARRMVQYAEHLKRERGLDIAGDLVAALGPRTTLAVLPLDPGLRGIASRREIDSDLFGLALVQEVKDEERMQRVVDQFVRMIGPLPFRTVEDVRIHIAPGVDGGALALFDGHLVLARHYALIADMITRRDKRRLRIGDDPMFRRAQTYAPLRRMIFSYTSPAPPLLDPESARDPRTRRMLRASGRKPAGWWRRYHDLTVFSMTEAGSGLQLTWFTGLKHPPCSRGVGASGARSR